ncbi:MAG: right-handed parallel beta-helix repeat-containing protein [Planctomycetota bacterium]
MLPQDDPLLPQPEQREITVGPQGADVVGSDGRAIQIAIDALAHQGGGTVRLRPGTYVLQDALRLRSRIALIGEPGQVLLKRAPVAVSMLAADADIGERILIPRDPKAFRVGMGLILRDRNHANPMSTMPVRITHIAADGIVHIDQHLTIEVYAENGASVVNYAPMIHGFEIEDIRIEGLVIDGSADRSDGLEGVWGGGIYVRRCVRGTIRNVVSKNNLGDGIRFGQSLQMRVENCETAGNSHYGIHPGSHSPYTVISKCHVHGNGSDGVYLCWGARHSVVADCHIHHNGHAFFRNGISTGHKDTDCRFERNHIHDNVKHGIVFRIKTEANGAHRTTVVDNLIENNGSPDAAVPQRLRNEPPRQVKGHGIFVFGVTHDLRFERNVIRETRQGDQRLQRTGMYFAPGVSRVNLDNNTIQGHPEQDLVDEAGVVATSSARG